MGILILLASVLVGYGLVKQFLKLERPLVSFCGAALVGCSLSGTFLYLFDLFCVMVAGNYPAGTFIYLSVAAAYLVYSQRRHNIFAAAQADVSELRGDHVGIAVLIVFLVFAVWLCWHTLSVTANGDISVYNYAWSDIVYHHAYIRSVVYGENVPIQYPYFANEPIHYHFLFNYYAGKISQLGLHSVTAYNTLSALGLVCLLMLIFEFGRIYFNSTLTGLLGAIFFIFHGSLNVFGWLWQNFDFGLPQKIAEKSGWIYGARFENWGLFNLHVFVNQRHLPFTLAFLVLLVIFVFQRLEKVEAAEAASETNSASWFTLSGNDFANLKPILFWIVIIGAMPFWNVLVAVVSIMFFGAFALIHFRHRSILFGFLLTAVAAALIVYPQLQLYKSGNSILTDYPKLHFGYALTEPSLTEFIVYYSTVLGIKLILMLAALFLVNWRLRWYFAVFLIGFVIANIFQLGTVLYDNNKLILTSLIFVNCYAAYLIVRLWRKYFYVAAFPAIILILAVTLAGIVDLFAVKNHGQAKLADETSKLKLWTLFKTKPKAVFLTNTSIPHGDSAIAAINLAGRYLYVVSSCVDSSCRVEPRMNIAQKIYSFSGGAEAVQPLLAREQIDYIVIDDLVRGNKSLNLAEAAFDSNFELVYQEAKIKIFQVQKGENPAAQPASPDLTNHTPETNAAITNAFEGGAGSRSGQFDRPRGIAVDSSGNFYVADTGNARLQKFAPDGKFLAAIGKRGTATGELRAPRGMAVDAAGDIYVTDEENNRLVKFAADKVFIKEWSGPAPGFNAPRDIAFAADKQLYILDDGGSRLVKFNPLDETFTVWKQGETEEDGFAGATGLTVGANRIYLADNKNNRIQIFDLDGKFIGGFAVPQWDRYIWHYPDAVIDEQAKLIYVTSGWTSEVLVFSLDGNFLESIKPTPPMAFNNISSIALAAGRDGKRLYVLGTGSDAVESGKPQVSALNVLPKISEQ